MLSRRERFQQKISRRIVPKGEAFFGRMERSVNERPGAVKAGPTSPERVNILGRTAQVPDFVPPPAMPNNIPNMIGSFRGIRRSIRELDENPAEPGTTIDEAGVEALEAFAKSAGALSIGYAEVPERLVFKGYAILHPHAVVLTMEMDKERIDQAPSKNTGLAVHETYSRLGRVSNEVAGYLRRQGYSAHAGHPLNGMALYPPIAEAAHLGGRGMHGLLNTPEMGPTVRIAAVFTSIENLPVPGGENPHAWVTEFCDHCRLCAKRCPVDAVYDEPIEHEDGRLTCVSDERCLPYFAVTHGCSICVAVCPFNKAGYERLHGSVEASGHREAVAQHVDAG